MNTRKQPIESSINRLLTRSKHVAASKWFCLRLTACVCVCVCSGVGSARARLQADHSREEARRAEQRHDSVRTQMRSPSCPRHGWDGMEADA